MSPDEAASSARSLAGQLRARAADDVDARAIGAILADCKDFRDPDAADAAWDLYRAAAQRGVTARFRIRQYNFALGAVAAGRDGATRVREIWDAIARAAVPPNAVTMALLARGLCRSARDVVPTLAVLREGISRGAPVDAYVLNVLLNVLLGSNSANENKEVTRDAALAVWTAGKGLHDERTLTSTIKVLSDAGDAEAAWRTFDDATRRGTPVDADCLAVMLRIESNRIDGSSGEERRSSKEAVELYRRVTEERGVVPDTACANAALTACSRDGNYRDALAMWRRMLGGRGAPPPDKASLAAVILSCGRAGRGDLAMRAFEEGKATPGVECDVVTVNVLLDACAKSDRPPGEALGILMDAIESRIPVDAYTISSLINAYCATRADAADVLDQAFAIVELGRFLAVRPTPAVTNSLLRACVAAGDLRRAVRTFEETVALAEDPATVADSISVRILLEAFAAAGDVPGAMARVDDARRLGVVVDESACVALVRACVDAGDVETAARAYDEATREHGVRPTLALVNALLAGLARGGSWREAIRLVSDDVIARDDVRADDALVELFARAFEVGGEEEQAATARQMGLWLTGSDDALIQHLLEQDEKGEGAL